MLTRPIEDETQPKGFTEIPKEFDARVIELKQ